jgi:hypothetical protein
MINPRREGESNFADDLCPQAQCLRRVLPFLERQRRPEAIALGWCQFASFHCRTACASGPRCKRQTKAGRAPPTTWIVVGLSRLLCQSITIGEPVGSFKCSVILSPSPFAVVWLLSQSIPFHIWESPPSAVVGGKVFTAFQPRATADRPGEESIGIRSLVRLRHDLVRKACPTRPANSSPSGLW